MVFKIVCLLLATGFCSEVLGRTSQDDVLEWLPYVPGNIPDDAILTGRTRDNERIFTGRAFLDIGEKSGYIPVDIVEGQNCTFALLDFDVVHVCDNISILSGKNDYLTNLSWHGVRQPYFMQLFDSDESKPVRVGWEVGSDNNIHFNSSLYISRSYFNDRYWNSKIYTSRPDQEKNNFAYYALVNYFNGGVTFCGSINFDVLLFRY